MISAISADAQKLAYQAIELIHFEGMYFRRDIARQAANRSLG